MEIDTEVVQLLDKTAGEAILEWSATQPVGVNMVDHYFSFGKKIEDARQIIYDKTKRLINLSLAA